MRADSDFPGGNAIIEELGEDRVVIRPDLRDTEGGWFYWCVRLREAAGRRVAVRLAVDHALAARGPAASWDGGATWCWLGAVAGNEFVVGIPAGCSEARLSMGMPYLPDRLERFLAARAGCIERTALCRSRKGREAPLLRIAPPGEDAALRLIITARHHACEMMASYALEGLLDAALGDDELGRWFRRRVELIAVPFMDRDGVEDGDQGKNRRPRDHNRDYIGESIYPEVGALRPLIERLPTRSTITVDLHCPWIKGDRNETIFQVGSAAPEIWAEKRRFASILAASSRSPLPYDPADDIPFGVEWNIAGPPGQGRSSVSWAGRLPGMRLATTLEIPYASARGAVVDQSTAAGFGGSLAAAIRAYLD